MISKNVALKVEVKLSFGHKAVIAKLSFSQLQLQVGSWYSLSLNWSSHPPHPPVKVYFPDFFLTKLQLQLQLELRLVQFSLSDHHPPNHYHPPWKVVELQLELQLQLLTSTTTSTISFNLIELGTAQPQLVHWLLWTSF